MGMQPSELYALELREFFAIYAGWLKLEEQRARQEWERTRWLASVVISPHLKSQTPVTQLFPLPWDKESEDPQILDYDPDNLDERRAHIEKVLGIKFNDNE